MRFRDLAVNIFTSGKSLSDERYKEDEPGAV
jgi:hypothetical protein